jgi:hypothetical protein
LQNGWSDISCSVLLSTRIERDRTNVVWKVGGAINATDAGERKFANRTSAKDMHPWIYFTHSCMATAHYRAEQWRGVSLFFLWMTNQFLLSLAAAMARASVLIPEAPRARIQTFVQLNSLSLASPYDQIAKEVTNNPVILLQPAATPRKSKGNRGHFIHNSILTCAVLLDQHFQ